MRLLITKLKYENAAVVRLPVLEIICFIVREAIGNFH